MKSDAPSTSETASQKSSHHVGQSVVDTLRREILQGIHPAGERLPSSRKLAERFGVSLNTMHIALGRLETMHLIRCQSRRRPVVVGMEAGQAAARTPHGLVLLLGEPGYVYRDFSASWGAQILYHTQGALMEQDFTTCNLYTPTVNRQVPAEALMHIEAMAEQAMGVIWLASSGLQPVISRLMERGVPVVTINATSELINHNMVKANNLAAGRMIGRIFVKLGYEHCLILTRGIKMRRFAPELAQGFVDSLMKEGVPLRDVEYRDVPTDTVEAARQSVADFLKDNPPPKGIFAAADAQAMGAIQALREAGLRVPEDVGVVSAVGLEQCSQFNPTISAWRQPTRRMGKEAASMLLKLLDNPGLCLPPVLVDSTFVAAQSLPHHEKLADIPDVEFSS